VLTAILITCAAATGAAQTPAKAGFARPEGNPENARAAATIPVTQFTYDGFANTAGLTLVGSAATASTSDRTVLRLAPASGSQSGAAYSTTAISLGNNASFHTQFQFRFTDPGGIDPADGIVFVLATNANGLGESGIGMGYAGLAGNSVAIEFDTYNNGGYGLPGDDGNSSNHVAIDTNGSLTNTALINVYGNGSCGFADGQPPQNPYTAAGCMSNGHLWTANIGYDGSHLTVTVSDPAEGSVFTAIDRYPIDLAAALGQNSAYVGFSAGTGGGDENHDIVNWTFASTPPVCNYSLGPAVEQQPASAVEGSLVGWIAVTTTAGCTWTAASDSAWIAITSQAPGDGSGVFSYQASPNTTGAARTGSVAVNGQTVDVDQAASGACAYSISPSANAVAASGGKSSVLFSAAPAGCPWSVAVAPAASSWLHVRPPTAGTGVVSIDYTVDENSTAASRSGTIGLASQTFTVTQAGGASATAPNIAPGGIVNAANNRAAAIARGSLIAIYGSNLGPAVPVQATTYPIPSTLGNVTVNVTQGATAGQVYLTYVSAGQISAILPSNTPLGNVQVTVTYNGTAGAPATINVVDTALGIFSSAAGQGPGIVQNWISGTNQPINTISIAAKPQQIGIIWATGLGPMAGGDNTPPAGANMIGIPVQVLVGGQPATLLYAGRAPNFAAVDNVYFIVPPGVPLGCYVPVQVNAAGVWSNTVTIAVSADGSHCKDTSNPLSGFSSTGGNVGVVGLVRLNYNGQINPSQAAGDSTIDLAIGDFAQVTAGGDMAQSPFMNLPPMGTCKSTNQPLDLGATLGSGGTNLDPSLARMLDAGASLTVTGPDETATISQIDTGSPYLAVLGGSVSAGNSISVGDSESGLFLGGGPFTITGAGGADVGPFSVTVKAPAAVTWTNEAQIAAVDRSVPLALTWTGGDPAATMLVLGGSTDPNTQASGGFECLAAMGAGTFTIPVNALADLVAVDPIAPMPSGQSSQLGVLGLMPLPLGDPPKFAAKGLNAGYAFETTVALKSVQVK
jgi:uncharacterized protein (TIGR03437 family)